MNRGAGFTLVELVIVVAIIGILTTMAIASLLKAREASRQSVCLVNQCQMDSSKALFATDRRTPIGQAVTWGDIRPYLKQASMPLCPSGGTYVLGTVGEDCYCTRHDFRPESSAPRP